MKLIVTQEHIDRATPDVGYKCVIAQALMDLHPGEAPRVGFYYASLYKDRVKSRSYDLGEDVSHYIGKFLNEDHIDPAVFEITPIKLYEG